MSSTVKKTLGGIGALIAGYLILTNYTGFKTDVGAASTGGVSVIQSLQGR